MDPASQYLILIGSLLLLGFFGEFFFSRTGLPDVVWLVGAGILVGPVLGMKERRRARPARRSSCPPGLRSGATG